MGNVLGNCCGGRENSKVKEEAQKKKQGYDFLQGKGENDLSRFDEAHETNNVATLVDLLDSKQSFARTEAQIHPWAAAPRTVGALAAFQLASMASKEAEVGEQPVKNEIRKTGGIPKLVDHLRSSEPDRKHASVVALSFLALDNKLNCIAMYNAGALPLLIACMKESPDGMKGAVADTARNIFVLEMLYRQAFLSAGGVEALVSLLEVPKGQYDPNTLYNQSEAIFHIEDLILEDGEEIPAFIAAVKQAGVMGKLEQLKKVDNSALVDDASGLLIRLTD